MDASQKREAFEIFHQANPEIYIELVALARQIAARQSRCSIRLLLEVVRWNRYLKVYRTDDEESRKTFKLNNNFAPYYARLISHQYPGLRNLFKLNPSEADLTLEESQWH